MCPQSVNLFRFNRSFPAFHSFEAARSFWARFRLICSPSYLGGVTALLPIFARDILHTGAWGLGFLRSAPAAGALAMSVLLVHLPMTRQVGIKMFAAVIVFGMATVIFSLSTSFAISLIALVILGAADNISVVIRISLVQLSTPDAMRGRVNAVNSLFIGTSNQLGEFESGMLAGLLGVIPSGVFGGIGTILIALLWMRLISGPSQNQYVVQCNGRYCGKRNRGHPWRSIVEFG